MARADKHGKQTLSVTTASSPDDVVPSPSWGSRGFSMEGLGGVHLRLGPRTSPAHSSRSAHAMGLAAVVAHIKRQPYSTARFAAHEHWRQFVDEDGEDPLEFDFQPFVFPNGKWEELTAGVPHPHRVGGGGGGPPPGPGPPPPPAVVAVVPRPRDQFIEEDVWEDVTTRTTTHRRTLRAGQESWSSFEYSCTRRRML